MNEIVVQGNIKIEDLIYEIRGKHVMLDSDLARLYHCKNGTKTINLAVKRHINRFPERFMFQLTDDEYDNLRFQIETSSLENNYGGRRYLPYAFTEEGVAMLATVLRTDIAEEVSVAIMDAFVKMRKFISTNLLEQRYINNMVFKLDDRVSVLENTFKEFEFFSNQIFYEGQIYDAHSLLLDIFNTSKKFIIIIDNYISKELLDILSKTNKKITIYTKNIDNNLINKYNSQYNNITIKITNSFHDRFIIIDNKVLYHCGASFKDLGKKCFGINKINDSNYLKELTNHLI